MLTYLPPWLPYPPPIVRDAAHGVDPNSSAFAPPPDQSHFSISPSGLAGVPEVGEEPEEEPARPDLLIIMSSMWIGTALAAIDGTCVASILGTVGSEFKVSREIQWLGVSRLCVAVVRAVEGR